VTNEWFKPANIRRAFEPRIRKSLARKYVDRDGRARATPATSRSTFARLLPAAGDHEHPRRPEADEPLMPT